MYRLFIDIPFSSEKTESESIEGVNNIIQLLSNLVLTKSNLATFGVTKINFRLGNDEDRQQSNYLVKTESGHVSNKKSTIVFMEFTNITSPTKHIV